VSNEVIIALGSNLGDPKHNLDQAVKALSLVLDKLLIVSSYWQSQPMNMAASADKFLNAVLVVNTSLGPHDLLRTLEEIERVLGRDKEKSGTEKRNRIYDSRIIDLDIIAFGNLVLCDAKLIIPHPRARERLFVLLPLAEICPDFCFPDQKLSLAELITQAPKMEITVQGYS